MSKKPDRRRGKQDGVHWLDNSPLYWLDDKSQLSDSDLDGLSAHLFGMLEKWPRLLKNLPSSLAWAHAALERRQPVLERIAFEVPDVVHWCVRLAEPDQSPDTQALGFNGLEGAAPLPSGNPAYDWLAQFGVWQFSPMASGTAQFGKTLEEIRHRLFEDLDLPEGSGNWLALYEADGDWCFADSATGQAHWMGFEWLGNDAVSSLPWTDIVSLILRNLLAGKSPGPDVLGFDV